ncbi:unnamed protein product [Paramecium octaurelia]|uniref:Uncharacterized protein n=1 Tax=Paramecium octaurelia TaxID=43137 RepID=A0A8S1WSU6_PAROT|nr:unnamed protein product [Paramecium octaurelia]
MVMTSLKEKLKSEPLDKQDMIQKKKLLQFEISFISKRLIQTVVCTSHSQTKNQNNSHKMNHTLKDKRKAAAGAFLSGQPVLLFCPAFIQSLPSVNVFTIPFQQNIAKFQFYDQDQKMQEQALIQPLQFKNQYRQRCSAAITEIKLGKIIGIKITMSIMEHLLLNNKSTEQSQTVMRSLDVFCTRKIWFQIQFSHQYQYCDKDIINIYRDSYILIQKSLNIMRSSNKNNDVSRRGLLELFRKNFTKLQGLTICHKHSLEYILFQRNFPLNFWDIYFLQCFVFPLSLACNQLSLEKQSYCTINLNYSTDCLSKQFCIFSQSCKEFVKSTDSVLDASLELTSASVHLILLIIMIALNSNLQFFMLEHIYLNFAGCCIAKLSQQKCCPICFFQPFCLQPLLMLYIYDENFGHLVHCIQLQVFIKKNQKKISTAIKTKHYQKCLTIISLYIRLVLIYIQRCLCLLCRYIKI